MWCGHLSPRRASPWVAGPQPASGLSSGAGSMNLPAIRRRPEQPTGGRTALGTTAYGLSAQAGVQPLHADPGPILPAALSSFELEVSLGQQALVIEVACVAQVCLLDQLGSPPGTHPHIGYNFRVQGCKRVQQTCAPDGKEVHWRSRAGGETGVSETNQGYVLPGRGTAAGLAALGDPTHGQPISLV